MSRLSSFWTNRPVDSTPGRLERSGVTNLATTVDVVDRLFDTKTVRLSGRDDDETPTFRLTDPDPEELDGDDANSNESLSLVHVRNHRRLIDALGVAWRLEELTDPQTGESERDRG
jgi:hypothetical protein